MLWRKLSTPALPKGDRMDLETFVADSLVQIANGLRRANTEIKQSWKAEGRELIGRQFFILPPNSSAADRTVEFDVAVTASAKGDVKIDGKTRLFVVDASAGATGALAHERVSRVRFRVQVEQSIF